MKGWNRYHAPLRQRKTGEGLAPPRFLREPIRSATVTISPLCTPEVSVNVAAAHGEAAAIRCKRWSCPVCAEINRARVIAIARRSNPRALLTLTVSSADYPDPADAADALKRGLRLMRLRLKRHERLRNFQFLAVFEKHKSGHPHLHLLIKGDFLPWRILRTMWEQITGSFMVDIRRIKSTGMAALYCAKYIGKDLAAFPGCKRWWRSHGFEDEAPEDYQTEKASGQWSRLTVDFHWLAEIMTAAGWQVEKAGRDRIRWLPPAEGPPGLSLFEALNSADVFWRARGGRA